MRLKFIALFVMCTLFTTELCAQISYPFSVTEPTWDTIVTTTTTGVNIRKSPSTTAPKLYMEDTGSCEQNIQWLSSPRKGWFAATEYNTISSPLLGTSGDWYKIRYLVEGWVSAKFCTTSKVQPMTQAFVIDWVESDPTEVGYVNSGKYAGFCILFESFENTLYVGRLTDKFIIYPYESSFELYSEIEYGQPVRLTDTLVEKILKACTKLQSDVIAYKCGGEIGFYNLY